jgi:hypothetical protein
MGPGSYGEFIMYGDRIDMGPAFLNAREDPVYDEVTQLLLQLPDVRTKSELARADLLQAVFGVACDPAPNGSRYKIGFPPCPACGTHALDTWSFAAAYIGPLLPITHGAWTAATRAEKLGWLRAARVTP